MTLLTFIPALFFVALGIWAIPGHYYNYTMGWIALQDAIAWSASYFVVAFVYAYFMKQLTRYLVKEEEIVAFADPIVKSELAQ